MHAGHTCTWPIEPMGLVGQVAMDAWGSTPGCTGSQLVFSIVSLMPYIIDDGAVGNAL